jgi:hypothetical protein
MVHAYSLSYAGSGDMKILVRGQPRVGELVRPYLKKQARNGDLVYNLRYMGG